MGARAWVIGLVFVAGAGVAAAHQDTYPMVAAEYRKRAEARLGRYRQRLEQHMVAQKLNESTRAAVRKRLATLDRDVRALIERRAADGTITLAEANEVKQLGKAGREAIYREFKIAADPKPKKPAR